MATLALGCAPQVTIFVRAKDGRQLAVRVRGNPAGHAVFSLHGTPGSREGPHPKGGQLYGMGVQLISYDRPGYGKSDRKLARLVADAADDVRDIADYLEIDRFAVLGRSGGGPHALACAALLPERVTRACALVSLAPPDAAGLDWFDGMTDSNVAEYKSAATDPDQLAANLIATAAKIRADPASHITTLGPEMPEADRQVVADPGIRAKLVRNFAEAVRDSADGWIDDALAFTSPWDFDVSTIRVPVLLWHGEKDVFSPVSHTRWLAERIPGAIRTIFPGKAHFGALEVVPDVLSWLIRPIPADQPLLRRHC
jgi:pimeloyl-ACP methyl ester carboxylesterase